MVCPYTLHANSKSTSMPSLPGAHAFVHSFAQDDSKDPTKARDEPISCTRSTQKWSTSKQNKGFGGSLKRGHAVDEMLSDPSTDLHVLFKEELRKKKLSIKSWQQCVQVPASAPSVFRGYAPILDCLCVETKKNGQLGGLVPVEVKASRPRKLKRRTAKDVGMKAPFDMFADTFGLRHQLQLCLQGAALGNSKPKGYVAYVDVAKPAVSLVTLNKQLWGRACASAS